MAIRVRGTADAALSGALLLGVHVPPHDVHEEVAIVPRLLVRDGLSERQCMLVGPAERCVGPYG